MNRLLISLAAISALVPLLCAAAPDTELKDTDGKTIVRYVVEAPDNLAPAGTRDPAKQVGLILCSAEHDRPTGDEILPVREALKRLGLSGQYVLLAGHSQAQKFSAADDVPIEKLLRWAMKTYPVNPRRVYMYGKGEGGKISGEFTMLHPDLVTAGITYSWGWVAHAFGAEGRRRHGRHRPRVLHGARAARPLVSHHHGARRVPAGHRARVSRHLSRVRRSGSAHLPSAEQRRCDCMGNAAAQQKHRAIQRRTRASEFTSHQPDGYYGGVALVGGAPAGVVIRSCWSRRTRRCAPRLRRRASMRSSTSLLWRRWAGRTTDAAPNVRLAAFRALGANANWRSEAAQRALVDSALDPAKAVDPRDRAAAVDGIAAGVKYQINGVRQDPPLFQALVTLLKDEDEELRTMAANILSPVRDKAFRGDMGRPEAKEPNGGWPHWIEGVTARAALYNNDYQVCGTSAPPEAAPFCEARDVMSKDPVHGFH